MPAAEMEEMATNDLLVDKPQLDSSHRGVIDNPSLKN